MPTQPPNIPSLSSKVDAEVRRAFDSLKGWYANIAKSGGVVTNASLSQDMAANPAVSGLFDGTIPPQIQNLVVTGAFSAIMLTWDDPRYAGFSYVEVHRNTVDNLGTAQLIGSTISTMYADKPPNASIAVTYYYWVRIISTSNMQGPYNATAGTSGHTATDPAYALEILAGQLTASQLHIDLNSRINMIDGDNIGMVGMLDRLGTALASLTTADSDRWERLLYERQVTDATVEIAPTAYCTLSAYTSEATCVAAGGVWKPGGTIRLKATADITSDVDASLRTLSLALDAAEGTISAMSGTVGAHTSTIASYLTDTNSLFQILSNGLSSKASASYVDIKTDAIANAADVAKYATENEIPQALAYMVLHADDAAKKLRSATANIATHAQEILSTATALEAESHFRTELDATVAANRAELVSNYYTKANIDTASAGWIASAVSTSNGNTASVISNYYTKTQIDSSASGWIDSAVAESATATGLVLNSYSTTAQMGQAITDAKTLLYASLSATFRQTTAPTVRSDGTALKANDAWFDTTLDTATPPKAKNLLSLWSGSAWVLSPDGRTTDNGAAIAVEQQVRASAIAPDYRPTGTYLAKKCVIYGGVLYRNTSGATITNAGTWTGTGWTAITADLYAQYNIRLDVNGYVVGVGLSNDGATSEFEIVADKLTFAPVATNPTAADGSPFFFLTAPTVVNGVTLPAGAYLKTAFIGDATITTAQIKTLTADKLTVPGTATIWDAIITQGKITNAYIGDTIQSTAYDATHGWQIDKNGTANFTGATIRSADGKTVLADNALTVSDASGIVRVKIGYLG